MVTLYGITNCDTIKKARRWLEKSNIEYHFHDYRKNGLQENMLRRWVEELGWETLLNRRGTTWRKLPEEQKSSINEEQAVTLMLEQPAIIKRPLLVTENQKLVGFTEQQYSNLFSQDS